MQNKENNITYKIENTDDLKCLRLNFLFSHNKHEVRVEEKKTTLGKS